MRSLYLQVTGAPPVFAVLHRGASPSRHTAVLLCPPFGWEDMCSYRVRRDWAERLAGDGYTTLRLDLPGSGDSAGDPREPGQLDSWTRAVAGAARWLREAQGARQVAAVGISLGGLVACRAALGGAPIDELVLWSVPARGRTLLRHLRAFSAFEVANAPEDGREDLGGPHEGGRDARDGAACDRDVLSGLRHAAGKGDGGKGDSTLATNGYLMSAETAAELERLDLARVVPRAPRLRRALVLGRDGLKVAPALPDALTHAGAEVTVADGPGYGALMVEPQDARTPIEVLERVDAWLAEGETHADDTGSWEAHSDQDPARPAPLSAPGDRDELVIHCVGGPLRERPVLLDGPAGPMFGVLTEPLGARAELTAVLLNAGPQRRTGPNRMWVEIARRWAARGVPTLRLDAAGIGDSDGDATVLARVAEFYRPVYAEQARAALDALAERGLPQRFVMLGLCAGAYWSVQAALTDERVAAVVMLNPRTLVYDRWRHTIRHTRRLRERALRPATWRKLVRGEIKLARHVETARRLLERAASAPQRARRRLVAPGGHESEQDPIEALFDSLRDRGQRGLLLFTGKEVLRRELTDRGVLERMDRWPNLQLEIRGTSADTHTLTPVWLQRQVHALVDSVLEGELERLPARAAERAA
jgi:alpha-beta hydrolase superfamily lysophospholipase